MRNTPFFDRHGIEIKSLDSEEKIDHLVNVLDHALEIIETDVEWGTWKGRKRKPCPEQPVLLTGMPIGQYHCPVCGMMLMASMPHLSPHAIEDGDPNYPVGHYEQEYGQEWPPGYEDPA